MGFEGRPRGGEDTDVDVLCRKPASIDVWDVDLRRRTDDGKRKRRRNQTLARKK